MKQGFELFKAHGYNDINGQDAISLGVNFARLGLNRDYILKGYTCRYGEAFFSEFIDGYDNAFNDEYTSKLEKVVIPILDVDYVFQNLRKNKILKDFWIDSVGYEPTDLRSGITTTTSVKMTHSTLPISFIVKYYEQINADSSDHNNWHIEASINHTVGHRRQFDRSRVVKIDGIAWQEAHYMMGSDHCQYWYEFRGHWNASVPHSSSVAKLLEYLTAHYTKHYNLLEKSKTTLGDLIMKKVEERSKAV